MGTCSGLALTLPPEGPQVIFQTRGRPESPQCPLGVPELGTWAMLFKCL